MTHINEISGVINTSLIGYHIYWEVRFQDTIFFSRLHMFVRIY